MIIQEQNSQKHIYLADDDNDDRAIFADALKQVDNSIILTQAEDGEQLMEILYVPPTPLPNIIFLDLNMPKRNGFECLKEIRNHQDLKDLNVIVFTTSNNPQNIETALELGASFYAVKPTTFDGLKKLIDNFLKTDWSYPELRKNQNFNFA